MTMLISADPATGSSSLPAFAGWELFSGGTVKFKGCHQLRVNGRTHWKRMQSITMCFPALIAKVFGEDVVLNGPSLVIEGIPPSLHGLGAQKGSFSNAASVHLHHAVAVICSCLPFEDVVELPVQRWKSFLKHIGAFDDYVKTDMNDACIIGLAYLCHAGWRIPQPTDEFVTQLNKMNISFNGMRNGWDAWHTHINKADQKNIKRKEVEKAKRKGV